MIKFQYIVLGISACLLIVMLFKVNYSNLSWGINSSIYIVILALIALISITVGRIKQAKHK